MTPADEALANALAGAMVPHPDHGAASLAAGATSARREALVSAVESLLRAHPRRPLVVRVGHWRAGLRLVDAVTDAVESALTAARAPGGLYEDRGAELLRSLGAWLFRARAAGHHGLCLLIDDLDAWCNARGAIAPDAAGALRPLLDEAPRRALSVFATCRAGAAAGSPALPRSVVDGFATVHPLGGVTTVTRDPSTLVAALGGRSFSLPALQDALAGWLELPPAAAPGATTDDTLIVFNAPLAPPLVGSAVESALEWPRPAPAPSRPPPSARVTSAVDATQWAPALRAAVQLHDVVRRGLSTPLREGDAEAAAALFTRTTSRLPLVMESLARALPSVGVPMGSVLGASTRALARVDQAWRAAGEGWDADDEAALEDRVARHAEAIRARVTAVVLFSGLRWDLWPRFLARLKHALPALREVSSGLWKGTRGDDPEVATDIASALRPRREVGVAGERLRVGVYTAALRGTSAGELDAAAAKVEAALPDLWRAIAGSFTGRTALLVAADAGVGEPVGEGRRVPRDGSPFAEVLPWGLFSYGAEGP